MTIIPPPDLRCRAVIYRAGWEFGGGRCRQPHMAGSDLCRKHLEMERAGQPVRRVLPPWSAE